MAFIESHQSLGTHLKLRRLARVLRIHRAQAIGHLHFLWWWALDNAPTGNLSALAPAELAEVAEWTGNEEVFLSALKECGWVDADGSLHDWDDYAGRLVEARVSDRLRKREERARARAAMEAAEASRGLNQDGQKMSAGCPPDVTRTSSRSPALQYPTLPNPTQPELSPVSPAQSNTPRTNAAQRKPASEREAVECGSMLGLSEEDSKAWWKDMEATGWAKVDGTPFGNWRREMSIHRDRLRERNAGLRPTIQHPGFPGATPAAPSAFTLKTQLDALDREIKAIRDRGHEDPMGGWEAKTEDDRVRYNALKKKRREVNAKLAEVT